MIIESNLLKILNLPIMSCRKTEIFTNKYKLVHGKVTDLKDMLIWNLDELYLKYYNESNSMLKNTNYQ